MYVRTMRVRVKMQKLAENVAPNEKNTKRGIQKTLRKYAILSQNSDTM